MICLVCSCTFDVEGNTKWEDDPVHEGEEIEVAVCPECHTEITV